MRDELFAEIDALDDDLSEQVFWVHKWKDGEPKCDWCGSPSWYFVRGRMRYNCMDCKRDYTSRSRTVFASSKLSYKQLLKAVVLADESNLTRVRVRDVVGVSESGASPLLARIRLVHVTGTIRTNDFRKAKRK